jgi:hypothetical protein
MQFFPFSSHLTHRQEGDCISILQENRLRKEMGKGSEGCKMENHERKDIWDVKK